MAKNEKRGPSGPRFLYKKAPRVAGQKVPAELMFAQVEAGWFCPVCAGGAG